MVLSVFLKFVTLSLSSRFDTIRITIIWHFTISFQHTNIFFNSYMTFPISKIRSQHSHTEVSVRNANYYGSWARSFRMVCSETAHCLNKFLCVDVLVWLWGAVTVFDGCELLEGVHRFSVLHFRGSLRVLILYSHRPNHFSSLYCDRSIYVYNNIFSYWLNLSYNDIYIFAVLNILKSLSLFPLNSKRCIKASSETRSRSVGNT